MTTIRFIVTLDLPDYINPNAGLQDLKETLERTGYGIFNAVVTLEEE